MRLVAGRQDVRVRRLGSGAQAPRVLRSDHRGVASEVLLPAPRGEQVDLAGGVAVDALQDINQIGVGVDVVDVAGDDEALQGGHRLGADIAPAEEPRLALM